jgi:hypothetical protein
MFESQLYQPYVLAKIINADGSSNGGKVEQEISDPIVEIEEKIV